MVVKEFKNELHNARDKINTAVNSKSPLKFQCPNCGEELYTLTEFSANAYVGTIFFFAVLSDVSIQTAAAYIPIPDVIVKNTDLTDFTGAGDNVLAAAEAYVPKYGEASIDDEYRCEHCGHPLHGSGDTNLFNYVEQED